MTNALDHYGALIFGELAMRERLPEDVFRSLTATIREGRPLDPALAEPIAQAMMEWALSHGATHYTHWFQPMTGITAEKHDGFIKPIGRDRAVTEFSGKELIRGEPDASSFPSGGLRATFEARGYTAWDPTAYAFIKDGTLCIPTAFCSYNGMALDKRTPLLRSMDALNREALRVLAALGRHDVHRVMPMAGAEQEYFLIDRKLFLQRMDLVFTGRTVLGARAPKGQEMEDHYFGSIKPRVLAFMRDLDAQLWALGVPAKTEHNETAPAQHELAVVYTIANIATDHNQLVMELVKRIAEQHDLACLLAEKPFYGVNGSGKHNNWSLATDQGQNLLDPGQSPQDNALFLLFLVAVLKAVDQYQDLLRIAVASAGNDLRLGASEAPPAIVSVFLGDELSDILDALEKGVRYDGDIPREMAIGVDALPHFPKDTTDRNRTSPFAYTGGKFEFRMPGASQSIADANFVLNTIVADALSDFADELEGADNPKVTMSRLIRETIAAHRRIIFNGNSYSDAWRHEALERGLYNLKTTADALPLLVSDKNIALFEKHHVLTETELRSRLGISLEHYAKLLNIEALTMLDMVRMGLYPASVRAQKCLAETILIKKEVLGKDACKTEINALERLSNLSGALFLCADALADATQYAHERADDQSMADAYRDQVLPAMQAVRDVADPLELLLPTDLLPYPTYAQMLFSV